MKKIIIISLISITTFTFCYLIIELKNTISELENTGYTFEASKKIALTELGYINPDAEYQALIED